FPLIGRDHVEVVDQEFEVLREPCAVQDAVAARGDPVVEKRDRPTVRQGACPRKSPAARQGGPRDAGAHHVEGASREARAFLAVTTKCRDLSTAMSSKPTRRSARTIPFVV